MKLRRKNQNPNDKRVSEVRALLKKELKKLGFLFPGWVAGFEIHNHKWYLNRWGYLYSYQEIAEKIAKYTQRDYYTIYEIILLKLKYLRK